MFYCRVVVFKVGRMVDCLGLGRMVVGVFGWLIGRAGLDVVGSGRMIDGSGRAEAGRLIVWGGWVCCSDRAGYLCCVEPGFFGILIDDALEEGFVQRLGPEKGFGGKVDLV